METQITLGVEVNVETSYLPEQSNSMQMEFFFTYHISLHNHNAFTVQLLRRKWVITHGTGVVETVEGEGVVGRTPVLYAGDSFEYTSGCRLTCGMGKMEGVYVFQNKTTGKEFEVIIPAFKLEAPEVLN